MLEDEELEAIRLAATRNKQTVSDWVRGALREARRREPSGSKEAKLALIRKASRHDFPTADIDQMLEEIERGYRA